MIHCLAIKGPILQERVITIRTLISLLKFSHTTIILGLPDIDVALVSNA